MARIAQDKAYRSFRNGLVTEVTGLTFPPDSCRDIVNCDINVNGSVRRRLGLTQEMGGVLMWPGVYADLVWEDRTAGPFSYRPYPGAQCQKEELAVTVHLWPCPGGQQDLAFVIFQVGNRLFIRNWASPTISDIGAIEPYIDGDLDMWLDYPDVGHVFRTNYLDAAKVPLQSAVGSDRIWFTSSAVVPFFIEYRPETRKLFTKPVGWDEDDPLAEHGLLLMRDFHGVEDGLKVDETPDTLSDAHKYNLLNQGWTEDLISDFFSATSTYPSNTMQWVLGKDENEDFDPTILVKQDFGTSRAPRGRAVINALSGRRDYVFDGIECAFYAGRLWLAGDSNVKRPASVYFSKVIKNPKDAGVLMQENDPTSEHFPDLLATDGGVIPVAEAAGIMKLLPFGQGLLVMAKNGIWYIYGGDGGFRADNYSVEKVSSTGILAPGSVVEADQQVVFWAENSIHAIVFPEHGYIPTIIDVAMDKIFTLYNEQPLPMRANAQGCYDPRSKRIFWSFLGMDDYRYYNPLHQARFNKMFILDTRTGAFTRYNFQDWPGGGQYAQSVAFPKKQPTVPSLQDQVVIGGDLVEANGEEVVVFRDARTADPHVNSLKVVMLDGVGGGVRVMEFLDTSFTDYATVPGLSPFNFDSYVLTGDELLEDLQRYKQAPYLHCFFRRTETGMEYDMGNLVFENPSGCYVRALWDWHTTGAGNRWSMPQKAYRYRRPFQPVDVNDPVDIGDSIVYTKLRIRGKGRSVTFRFDAEPGKDMQLLGYSVAFTADGV
jgi:hypothetical protein